jgi:hypothetical protein
LHIDKTFKQLGQFELHTPPNMQSGWQPSGHTAQSCGQLLQVSPREAAQLLSPHQPIVVDVFW